MSSLVSSFWNASEEVLLGDGFAQGDDLNGNDNGFDYSKYYPHEGNSSITSSVTISFTPEHYHMKSWGILWSGYILAILVAAYQIRLDNQWFTLTRQQRLNGERGDGNNIVVGSEGNSTDGSSGNTRRAGRIRNANMSDVEQSSGVVGGNGNDGESLPVSGADYTRSRFRKLLIMAMFTRAVMIPIQLWSNRLWVQLIADTFPEMAFASAWTLLVSFFVQLVGVALGTSNIALGPSSFSPFWLFSLFSKSSSHGSIGNPSAGSPNSSSSGTSLSIVMVLQLAAYTLYWVLIITYTFWKPLSMVILCYALLFCIYVALLSTTLYFCPKLLSILKPSLMQHSGLAIRLITGSLLCVLVFTGRSFGLASKVIVSPSAPPAMPTGENGEQDFYKTILQSWWWQYGALELIPCLLFLIMTHPNINRLSSASPVNSAAGTPTMGSSTSNQSGIGGYRSSSSRLQGRNSEGTPLVRPVSAYGSNGTSFV